jgi:hypothetical protein
MSCCGGFVLLARQIVTVGIDPDPAPLNVHRRWVTNKPGLAKHSTDDLPGTEMLRSAIAGAAFVSRPGVGGHRAAGEDQGGDDQSNKCLRCQRSRTWRSHGASIRCAAFEPQANPLMRSRKQLLVWFIREPENCPGPPGLLRVKTGPDVNLLGCERY